MLPHRPIHRLPRHLMLPGAVLLLALLLSLGVSGLLAVSAGARDRTRFENGMQATSDRIQGRLDAYMALLQGTAGLLASSQEVTDEEFAHYVELLQLEVHYPGIQGIGFSQRLQAAERPEFERQVRLVTGLADFRVWPLVSGEEMHSVVLLEPRDARNQAAMGFNMHSEPTRREAMDRARDSGEPALSGRVTLKQEIDERKQSGFLLYVPVYRAGSRPRTVQERREALVGFAYSPFRADDLLNGIFGSERRPRVAFQLYDGERVDPERLLHSSHPAEALSDEPMLTTTTTMEVAGRPWTLAFATLPAFEETASRRMVAPFAVASVLVSLTLFALMLAQVRAREQAERAARGLREADRRKDDFLAMLAHELRNPLAPVLSAVQLMARKQQQGQPAEREREVVERQVHHMRRLVDDLLDVSRVTRGKIQLQRQPLELTAAAGRALELVRPFIEERGHTLGAELSAQPVWAEADPVRFEQVLSNLLHNAAKYTAPGGRIRLEVAREGAEAVVRVADTGMGIPAEALPHLFEPFMQVSRTLDRAQGGLGLGLTLVKRLVEMHGGRVEAASEGVGKGSVFTVRLPLLAESRVPREVPEALRPVAPVGAAERRVLVVDDNVDAAELLGEVLQLDGHPVAVVHDGAAALERVESFDPEVVFLDIGLPGLDGYEVARRLRQRPGGRALRLVAVTGYGQASDRQRSREAGFDAHLVKPVELDAVRALVVRGAGTREEDAGAWEGPFV